MLNKSKPSRNVGGGYLSNTLNARFFKRIRLVSIPLLFTFILTVSSVYADNNTPYIANKGILKNTSISNNTGIKDDSEQYKVVVTKDEHVLDTHVEVLPDSNGEYWIPKDYDIKVTGDYEDGYKSSSTSSNQYKVNTVQNVRLSSEPTNELTTEERLTALEEQVVKAGDVPVGTVLSLMGNEAPDKYLVCDGTTYNISDYPDLADYFKEQFGSTNKWVLGIRCGF